MNQQQHNNNCTSTILYCTNFSRVLVDVRVKSWTFAIIFDDIVATARIIRGFYVDVVPRIQKLSSITYKEPCTLLRSPNSKTKTNVCLCAKDHCILHVVCMVITHQVYQSIDQPGKVTSPACVQLNRENEYFYSVLVRA